MSDPSVRLELTVLAVGIFCLGLVAVAQVEVLQRGNLRVSFERQLAQWPSSRSARAISSESGSPKAAASFSRLR